MCFNSDLSLCFFFFFFFLYASGTLLSSRVGAFACLEMSALTGWVSDRLYDLLGLSDSYTAEFLVGTAKKCNSEQSFLKKLKDTGAIKVNDSIVSFASELWNKVPHKSEDRYAASREKEKTAILQYKKNKTYSLVSDDDDELTSSAQKKAKRIKSKKEEKEMKVAKRKRNIRTEKAAAWESESEEDGPAEPKKEDSDSDSWER